MIVNFYFAKYSENMLTIRIFSFSYIYNGIPQDETPNGGGFVFDCRFIYNPGKKEEFKNMTGRDEKVIKFLDEDFEMQKFLKNVFDIIDSAINDYSRRDFMNLMVSFGCTGGQHRSVYSAEKLNEHINKKNPEVKTILTHINI